MRITKILLFLFCAAGPYLLKGQSNLFRGYYVTLENDTVRGYIEYRTEERNQKLFVFRKNFENTAQKFLPENVIAYSVDEKVFYESHTYIHRRGEELTGFFKVIVRGKLSLLTYKSKYFAKDDEGKLHEISKRQESAGGNKIRTDFRGIGVLKALMIDCPEIQRGFLDRYQFEKNFAPLFRKYNECIGSSYSDVRKIPVKPRLELGIQISPTITKLTLVREFSDADFGQSVSTTAGAFSSICFPRLSNRISFVLEASYNKCNNYSYFQRANTNNDVIMNYSSLKIPVLIRFSSKVFFADLGLQKHFILSQAMRWRVEYVNQSSARTEDGSLLPFSNSLGTLIGIGGKFMVLQRNVRLSARYSKTRSPTHAYRPVFETVEIIVSAQLSK